MKREDIVRRQAALTRLAVATRERLPDNKQAQEAFFRIYLDDFEHFSTDTYERACRRLEASVDWFPKKHELMEACHAMAKWKAEHEKPVRLQLTDGDTPVDPAKWGEFRSRVDALLKKKAMP